MSYIQYDLRMRENRPFNGWGKFHDAQFYVYAVCQYSDMPEAKEVNMTKLDDFYLFKAKGGFNVNIVRRSFHNDNGILRRVTTIGNKDAFVRLTLQMRDDSCMCRIIRENLEGHFDRLMRASNTRTYITACSILKDHIIPDLSDIVLSYLE
jgi:hypothetical protein